MDYFINLENGNASLDTSRNVSAIVTDFDDIVDQFGNADSETLTCCLSIELRDRIDLQYEELNESFLSADENSIRDAVFSDKDILYQMLSSIDLEHEIIEYPDLRDQQHDLIESFLKNNDAIKELAE